MEQSATLPTPAPANRNLAAGVGSVFRRLLVPLLAVVTAILIGSIFILLAGLDPLKAYQGLLEGAFGSDVGIIRSLTKMAPLILTGLAVAIAFKGGLFNIGAEGQLLIGSLCAAWAGFAVTQLPPALHILIALAAGTIGGGLWGFIPGILKARTGAHEVIVTIMLNSVASKLLEWSVSPISTTSAPGPLAFCRQTVGQCASNPDRTPPILNSAMLPILYRPGGNPPPDGLLHLGVVIAIVMAVLISVVLYRTTFGFELRMVGLNPSAARYSGIKVARMTVITMVIAGSMAGLAGAIETLGVNHDFETNQSATLGFDGIPVSLLAANNPVAIIPSAFLFGAMNAGSGTMQTASHVPTELIQIIQALILMFVAADQIIRRLYRVKAAGGGEAVKLSTGWGKR